MANYERPKTIGKVVLTVKQDSEGNIFFTPNEPSSQTSNQEVVEHWAGPDELIAPMGYEKPSKPKDEPIRDHWAGPDELMGY